MGRESQMMARLRSRNERALILEYQSYADDPATVNIIATVMAHDGLPTLSVLSGLVISISGERNSPFVAELGDFTLPSSCASSSISVLSVPFESTGEGSVV